MIHLIAWEIVIAIAFWQGQQNVGDAIFNLIIYVIFFIINYDYSWVCAIMI